VQYLSGLAAALVAVVGWYIAAVNRAKDKINELSKQISELRIAHAGLEARATAHDGGMADIKREISDIRDNMVRRHDLDSVIDAVGKRIDDAMRRK